MNKLHELRSEIKLLEPTFSGICLSVTSSGCIYIDGEVDSSDLKKLWAVLEKYEGPAPIKPQPITTHNTMNGFTRQETLALSGITVGMMSYLDETGEIVPVRTGNPRRPNVVYSVEQVIDLKIASVLRPRMSLKGAVEVVRFVRDNGYCKSVFQSPLATVNGEMMRTSCWTEAGLHDDSFGRKVLEVARDNKGHVTVQDVGMIGNVLGAIREAAIDADILDFEKRIKGTLLETP